MRVIEYVITLVALVGGMWAVERWAHYQSAERTAYARGYAAAVDSLLAASAPPETMFVVVRAGEKLVHYTASGYGMVVRP